MIHNLRRQTLELQVASEEVALRLQPRLADLNRIRLLPAIERVLDELCVPDRHIRIDRLEVDLGVVAAEGLEPEVEERLVRELRRALQEALHGAGGGSAGRARWQTVEAARRELLEIHLLHGIAPFWAPRPVRSLEELVLAMADSDPGGLVETVCRLSLRIRVLERLTAQLGKPVLERLIDLLEPLRSSLPAGAAELVDKERIRRGGLAAARAAGARQLLRVARDAPELRQEILGESPAPLFERMLDQLCPGEEGVFRALLRAFAAIPAPYRPRPDSLVRKVIFDQVLRLGPGEPLAADFFTGVIRELFAWPLAEPVRVSLLETASAWAGSGRLPARRVEAFRSAVEMAAGDTVFAAVPDRWTDEELRTALLERLGDPPDEAGPALRRQVADRRTRDRWVRVLPEAALVRLAELIEPRKHRELRDAAEILTAAWREAAPAAAPRRRALWGLLLEHLAQPNAEERSLERLVAAFLERSPAGARTVLDSAERLAKAGGHHALFAALQRSRRLLPAASPSRRRAPRRNRRLPGPDLEADAAPDPIYSENAGLVLVSAFLPPFFGALEMLRQEEDGRVRLRDPRAASRAVHLLQLLVDGRTAVPEPLLVLNKILCGLPLGVPVERGIEPTEREREVCEKLLRSILAGWPALANTSVAGLQETFLQRAGRLERTDDGWRLRVHRKTVDVLVDEIPWSLSVSFHGWMPQPLHVIW